MRHTCMGSIKWRTKGVINMEFNLTKEQKRALCIEAKKHIRDGDNRTGLCSGFTHAYIALGYGHIDDDNEALELVKYMGFEKPPRNVKSKFWWPLTEYYKMERQRVINNRLIEIIDNE